VIEYEKSLGYLWPVSVWKKHKPGETLPKKAVQTHVVDGQRVRGVILDASHGTPLGVIHIAKKSSTGVSKVAELASMETHSAEEMADAHERARKRARLSASQLDASEGGQTGAIKAHRVA
jgi:hypothetical protein